MAHHVIEIVHTSAHPVSRLFDELSQHENLRRVFGVPVRRLAAGSDQGDGVGSVRRIGVGPLGIDETITDLERDRSIGYRITRGGSVRIANRSIEIVRNHAGWLAFEAHDHLPERGSRVTWTIEFDAPPIIGPVLSRVLDRVLRRGLARLEVGR